MFDIFFVIPGLMREKLHATAVRQCTLPSRPARFRRLSDWLERYIINLNEHVQKNVVMLDS